VTFWISLFNFLCNFRFFSTTATNLHKNECVQLILTILRKTLWHSISYWHLSRHILFTMWSSICHWQCDRPYLTGIVGVHISLTFWAAISHLNCEPLYLNDSLSSLISPTTQPPYLTDNLSLPISLTVCTLIYPLLSSLAHWLCHSVNAVRYPT